ncbi:MAG TPA: MFS transporter [Pirellulales bacterium]|jgi:MFS family permease|nr:MFS transporter [Pirellulales bacterium]
MQHDTRQIPTRGQWLALAAALLGWLFDGAEMGMFSLVGRPALRELLGETDESRIGFWFGIVTAGFLVGAATGGVLFGWLGDRLGRVRAMTLSVLVYALFTGACGLAQSANQIAVLRFIASLGMGGEWSLGVALVMELWPNRSRALLAGVIGAAGNVGYLLIGLIGLGLSGMIVDVAQWLAAAGLSETLVDRLTGNHGWRLLMLIGSAPAVLTFLIRLFVPESQKWREQQDRGAASHWAVRDLAGVAIGALAALSIVFLAAAADLPLALRIGGTIAGVVVAAAGFLYPVARYIGRADDAHDAAGMSRRTTLLRMLLAAGLSGVALLGTWGSLQWAPTWADQMTGSQMPSAKSWTQIWAALGAIVGTILAALAGDWLGRRAAYCLLCVTSLVSILWLYQGHDAYGPGMLGAVFVAGLCTASFYGWLPLYLPELFPTRVRGTGQGFGFNFGRILAAIGTLQVGNLMGLFRGGYPQACSTMSAVYLLGLVLIVFAPETRGQSLPE